MLGLFAHFATQAATTLGIPCSRTYSLPTRRKLWDGAARAVRAQEGRRKKAQDTFEWRVRRCGLIAWDADPGVLDLRRHTLGGVGMQCAKWERVPMGAGRKVRGRVIDAIHRERQQAATAKSRYLKTRPIGHLNI